MISIGLAVAQKIEHTSGTLRTAPRPLMGLLGHGAQHGLGQVDLLNLHIRYFHTPQGWRGLVARHLTH